MVDNHVDHKDRGLRKDPQASLLGWLAWMLFLNNNKNLLHLYAIDIL